MLATACPRRSPGRSAASTTRQARTPAGGRWRRADGFGDEPTRHLRYRLRRPRPRHPRVRPELAVARSSAPRDGAAGLVEAEPAHELVERARHSTPADSAVETIAAIRSGSETVRSGRSTRA